MSNLFELDEAKSSGDHIDEGFPEGFSEVWTLLVSVPVPVGEVAAISPQHQALFG